MSAVKYARGPAAFVLLALLLLAGTFAMSDLHVTTSTAPAVAPADMAGFERSIVTGRADARTWFAYAEKLRAEGRPVLAAKAYQRVLDSEPYHREALFWTAVCLANSGDIPRLEAYMEQVVLGNAKLAVEIFQRRELAPHVASQRMSSLLEQAQDQARD